MAENTRRLVTGLEIILEISATSKHLLKKPRKPRIALVVVIWYCFRSMLLSSTNDYVTRDVTLGGNSSAIATALLLPSDPRAAALSSLSMGLFGTSMVALTSITSVAGAVIHLVGRET